MSKAHTPKVGLVVLTGENWRIERNQAALLRELATIAYRAREVKIVTDYDEEAEKVDATVLICHNGFSSAVYESNPVNDMAWLCFITTNQHVEAPKPAFNAKTSIHEFLKSLPYVWAPRTLEELDIALGILGLRNKASI